MLKKIHIPSPNFEERTPGATPDLIVLHYTDMKDAQAALDRLRSPEAKVSAHFLINKEGVIYQLVDPMYRAWHAGVSSWQGRQDTNNRSIGIELDNAGHAFGPAPFPNSQIDVLIDLLAELTRLYAILPHQVVGHSDVAPLRKKDPGELFPWGHLASKGFGLWPLSANPAASLESWGILDIQKALVEIGYHCPQTGIWDEGSTQVCRAFQRHFTPHERTGHPTHLTGQVLQGLLKTVKSLEKQSSA